MVRLRVIIGHRRAARGLLVPYLSVGSARNRTPENFVFCVWLFFVFNFFKTFSIGQRRRLLCENTSAGIINTSRRVRFVTLYDVRITWITHVLIHTHTSVEPTKAAGGKLPPYSDFIGGKDSILLTGCTAIIWSLLKLRCYVLHKNAYLNIINYLLSKYS